MNFVICAGHSQSDPGAVGNGYKEADLAKQLRNLVAKGLRDAGKSVIEDDSAAGDAVNAPLSDAIALVKRHPEAVAIEFHFNAGPPNAQGVEVLCHSGHKMRAQKIAGAISGTLPSPCRGDKGWKDPSSGQHHRLGFCDAGGLIVEVEFISCPGAIRRYVERESLVAASIVSALL